LRAASVSRRRAGHRRGSCATTCKMRDGTAAVRSNAMLESNTHLKCLVASMLIAKNTRATATKRIAIRVSMARDSEGSQYAFRCGDGSQRYRQKLL
jgi:hypothetical protein